MGKLFRTDHNRYASILCLSLVLIWTDFAMSDEQQKPQINFDILHIKTPQLIGIIAGCMVFVTTISVVLYLLFASGTWAGFIDEMKSGKPIDMTAMTAKAITPQLSELPKLYDHLIDASKTLPLKPIIPELKGPKVTLNALTIIDEAKQLYQICNGEALFGESAYNPLRIWGWLLYNDAKTNIWESEKKFVDYFTTPIQNGVHLIISDNELQKPIGLITLTDNMPNNLVIKIENIWLTPAFQAKKRSHEAIALILDFLFNQGYRRIFAEIDNRNSIGKRFFDRCTFSLEAVLRKHKVVEERNRDSALYVVLNSEWMDNEAKLKKYLNWNTKPKATKLAAIDISIGSKPSLPKLLLSSNKNKTEASIDISKSKRNKNHKKSKK